MPNNILSYSSSNYIKYTLRAYLPPFDADSEMQAFDLPLNLR